MKRKSSDRQKHPIRMKFTPKKDEQFLGLLVKGWLQSDIVVKSYGNLKIENFAFVYKFYSWLFVSMLLLSNAQTSQLFLQKMFIKSLDAWDLSKNLKKNDCTSCERY